MKRLFAFLCAFAVIFTLLFTNIAAQEEKTVSWRWLDTDNLKVTDGTSTFEAHTLKPGYVLRPRSLFSYSEPPLSDYSSFDSYAKGGGILWRYTDVIYATEEAFSKIKAFTDDGIVSSYYLTSEAYTYYSPYSIDDLPIDAEKVEAYDGLPKDTEIDVSELEGKTFLRIYAYDETDCIVHVHGAFYETDDGILYIYEDALDNSYFSSDFSFSFRSVPGYEKTVNASLLSEATARDLYDLKDSMFEYDVPRTQESETDFVYERDDRYFGVYRVIFGYVLPLIPLCCSAYFFFRAKDRKNKIRRAVPVLIAAFWIAFSIVGTSLLP